MRTQRFGKYFLLLLSATLISAWLPAFGQEGGDAPAAEENEGLTQGQAALVIARKLGLFPAGTVPTQAKAIQLLSTRNVAPKAGWDADALLSPGQLARLLVQALGLEEELTEAQIAGNDPQPYIDLLVERYDFDVNDLGNAVALNANVPGGAPAGNNTDDASSDPLLVPPFLDDNNDQDAIPISQDDLDAALDAIVGVPGSAEGGQVGGGSSNITPSAP